MDSVYIRREEQRDRRSTGRSNSCVAYWIKKWHCTAIAQPPKGDQATHIIDYAPHLPLFSKSLQSRVLTIKIYHTVSNNIISTRKRSEALLCGLAKVEFIRTYTQVGTMIAADNFKSTEIEPQGPGETSSSSSAHPRIETFVESTAYSLWHILRVLI